MNTINRNYDLLEAAEFLRLPVDTFRKHRPEIGGSKLGRRWIFTEKELIEFMERKRSKPLHELTESMQNNG